jgi:hypothetical protein
LFIFFLNKKARPGMPGQAEALKIKAAARPVAAGQLRNSALMSPLKLAVNVILTIAPHDAGEIFGNSHARDSRSAAEEDCRDISGES